MNSHRFYILSPAFLGAFLMTVVLLAKNEKGKSVVDQEELVIRMYRVPSVFVTNIKGEWYQQHGESGNTKNPFVEPDPKESGITKGPKFPFPGLQKALEDYGIPFPDGAYVKHDTETGKLEIRGDSKTIELFEAYIESRNGIREKQLNIRAEIYQMPAKAALKVQQICGPMGDHTPIWEKVQGMVERNQASLVTSVATMARSGQRAKADDINEVIYPSEVKWDAKEETVLPTSFETRNVGTILEVDPILGADEFAVDISFHLEHHTAPPIMRQVTVTSPNTGRVVVVEMPEMHTKNITTQITLSINSSKCIGAWRPTGKPEYAKTDVMQVVFMRVDMQALGKIVPWQEE